METKQDDCSVKSYLILIQEVKMDGLLPQQSDQNQYILKLFMILFIYLVVLYQVLAFFMIICDIYFNCLNCL